ncbi:hypothetical protein BC829DRAFT_443793 [Chytridium lagenaria]|nr:hypothetical protein BC829DRAFT_443793 [Chytridium lagenaria]
MESVTTSDIYAAAMEGTNVDPATTEVPSSQHSQHEQQQQQESMVSNFNQPSPSIPADPGGRVPSDDKLSHSSFVPSSTFPSYTFQPSTTASFPSLHPIFPQPPYPTDQFTHSFTRPSPTSTPKISNFAPTSSRLPPDRSLTSPSPTTLNLPNGGFVTSQQADDAYTRPPPTSQDFPLRTTVVPSSSRPFITQSNAFPYPSPTPTPLTSPSPLTLHLPNGGFASTQQVDENYQRSTQRLHPSAGGQQQGDGGAYASYRTQVQWNGDGGYHGGQSQ